MGGEDADYRREMLRDVIIVGVGGALGTIARFLLVLLFAREAPLAFPLGTFVVNVTGCLIMGSVFGLSQRYGWMTTEWRFFLATGFCGGFTTFSAFAYENLILLQHRDHTTFLINTLLSFAACLLAVFIGFTLARG